MVIRRGLRTFIPPLAFYAAAFGCAYYFVNEARLGQRGLDAKHEIRAEQARVGQELDALKLERVEWERRVALFKPEAMDRDLLDERVRRVLNRVNPHDVVIMTPVRKD